MSYWKSAGMTYLQYVNVATTALRSSVKASALSKYGAREEVQYRKQLWANGKAAGERVTIRVPPMNAPVQAK